MSEAASENPVLSEEAATPTEGSSEPTTSASPAKEEPPDAGPEIEANTTTVMEEAPSETADANVATEEKVLEDHPAVPSSEEQSPIKNETAMEETAPAPSSDTPMTETETVVANSASESTPAPEKPEETPMIEEGNLQDAKSEPAPTEGEPALEKPAAKEGEAPKETKKRVRRVGRTPTRKILKLDEGATPSMDIAGTDNTTVDASTAALGAAPESTQGQDTSVVVIASPPPTQGVLSKHDEKWHAMFQKLLEYKAQKNHTLVPQCYTEDPRLGRWVHYQRVEYWIFQQKGSAKITEERIARLNNIGFEWDPQKAQWEKMFRKLQEFKKEFNHCRVPKGYDKDWELANWVRNQRLEQANLNKEGKKSRMTPERFKLLDDLGFKWSSPTPARSRRSIKSSGKKANNGQQPKQSKPENVAPIPGDEKPEEVPPAPVEQVVSPEEGTAAASNAVGTISTEVETANGIAEETVKVEQQEEDPEETVEI